MARAQPNYPLVRVEWDDAAGAAVWQDEARAKRYPLAEAVSVGWLIRTTRRKIVLAASFNVKDGSCADVTAIPRRWIRSVRRLDLGRDHSLH